MTDIINSSVSGSDPSVPVSDSSAALSGAAAVVTPMGISGASSIAPSTAEVDDEISASFPTMIPPSMIQYYATNLSPELAIGKAISEKESEIISSMLDEWGKSIKEQMDAFRAKEKDPNEIRKREALSNVLDTVVVSSYSKHIAHSIDEATAIDPEKAINPLAMLPLLLTGLIFSGGGEGASVGSIINDGAARFRPGTNGSQEQDPSMNMYKDDFRAELGLLGAFWMQGAWQAANTQSVIKGVQPGDETAETAKNYARIILNMIGSGQISELINNLKTEKGIPIDPAHAKNLETQIKIILLATALAALYRSEKEGGTGGLSGPEFEGLLNGSIETFGPNKNIMDELVKGIKDLFRDPSFTDASISSIKSALLAYFNKTPSLEELTNPSKIFNTVSPYLKRQTDDFPS